MDGGGNTELFSGRSVVEEIELRKTSFRDEIKRFERQYVANVDPSELRASLVEKYSLDVPRLCRDRMQQFEPVDTTVFVPTPQFGPNETTAVPGTLFRVEIPYEGEPGLFDVRPEEFSTPPPSGIVELDRLYLKFVRVGHESSSLSKEVANLIAAVEVHLSSLHRTATRFAKDLNDLATELITDRQEKIAADLSVAKSLNIPLRRRNGAPLTHALPVRRCQLPIPRSAEVTDQREMLLTDEEYEHILSVLRSMFTVMEQSPRAFTHMREEDIRTHFLVQLNAQYEGLATGETFNFDGKTDILIKWEGEVVFIAECKFWKGEMALMNAMHQLLSYLRWRDTKAALLVFNRKRDFSAVLLRLKDAVPRHPLFKRVQSESGTSEIRYIFGQPRDCNREVSLTVMAFDVPRAKYIRRRPSEPAATMGTGPPFPAK